MKVNGYSRDLQVLSFIGEAGLEPRWVGLEAEVRQIGGVKALPPWPLLHLPQLGPWLWTPALGPPGPQRWLMGLKAPDSDEAPVMFNQASSELCEGTWRGVSSERDSIIAYAWWGKGSTRRTGEGHSGQVDPSLARLTPTSTSAPTQSRRKKVNKALQRPRLSSLGERDRSI